MNATHPLGTLTRDDDDCTVTFIRELPHPVEKVWRAVTEPEHLGAWFPDQIVGERRAGAPLRFVPHGHAEMPTVSTARWWRSSRRRAWSCCGVSTTCASSSSRTATAPASPSRTPSPNSAKPPRRGRLARVPRPAARVDERRGIAGMGRGLPRGAPVVCRRARRGSIDDRRRRPGGTTRADSENREHTRMRTVHACTFRSASVRTRRVPALGGDPPQVSSSEPTDRDNPARTVVRDPLTNEGTREARLGSRQEAPAGAGASAVIAPGVPNR